jgi:hypothetical protein
MDKSIFASMTVTQRIVSILKEIITVPPVLLLILPALPLFLWFGTSFYGIKDGQIYYFKSVFDTKGKRLSGI